MQIQLNNVNAIRCVEDLIVKFYEIYENTEVVITEQNQINSNEISFENVYNAIRNVKPEYQRVLFENYKLFDLYALIKDETGYQQHTTDLTNTAKKLISMLNAVTDLRKEAIKECNEAQKLDIVDCMSQCFDKLSEADKKKVCGAMMGKKEFFSDAYGMMMDVFGNVLEKKEVSGNR